ncbi:MAG: hypothetical protein ACOCP8_09035 [archaeon]
MMNFDEKSQKKYTKRILNIIFKKFILNWLGDNFDYFSFNPVDTVSQYSEYKMEFIKSYIRNMISQNNSYETVYIEIKDFVYFEELLNYLSPCSYYLPEDTLIYLLRQFDKINIRYNPETDCYKFSFHSDCISVCKNDQQLCRLSIFFRSYTKILLDVKRKSYNLNELYDYLLKEEIDYKFAKFYNLFRIFNEDRGYSIEEILKLLGTKNFKKPRKIYFKQVKYDYYRFNRIISDYYGLKCWDNKTKFKVYIDLFNKFCQEEDIEKVKELGPEVLELLPESGLKEEEKNKITNLVNEVLENGNIHTNKLNYITKNFFLI